MLTSTTRDRRRLAGRLVYDLDESETTETFDASSQGVNYTIPFGMIASIVLPDRVTLGNGEQLQLEPDSDLGERNAGILIFVNGGPQAECVPWKDVAQIVFDQPPAERDRIALAADDADSRIARAPNPC